MRAGYVHRMLAIALLAGAKPQCVEPLERERGAAPPVPITPGRATPATRRQCARRHKKVGARAKGRKPS